MARRPRVALALGGGGARGYAHIGVIEVIEERGYEIVSIAGTSMGALVGGLHAARCLDPYTDWVRGLTQRQVIRLLDPSLRAAGAIRAEKIFARVSELLSGAVIEALPVAFTAVATDLLAGREVWFQEGPVDVAIRASIALPTVISPIVINGRLLADGGLLNPIPTEATAASQADVTIAVSAGGLQSQPNGRSPARESSVQGPMEEWLDRFRRSTAQALDRDLVRSIISRTSSRQLNDSQVAGEPRSTEVVEEPFGRVPAGLRMLEVVDLSLDAMQSLVTRTRLAAYPPDLLMTIPRTACRTLDFHRATEMIALGRRVASDALDRSERLPKPHSGGGTP
jgi:NTE family protein